MLKKATLGGAVALLAIAGTAQAKVSADEAAKLCKELTCIGAEAGANSAGTIPAWKEFTKADIPSDYKAGGPYTNPFAGDAVSFEITGANMAKYEASLTEGHKALLKRYPSYKMKVYPSQRRVTYPKAIQEASVKNATTAVMEGSQKFTGAMLGFPFPMPTAAPEVITNHKVRYRGDDVIRANDQGIVYPGGRVQIVKRIEEALFTYGNIANPGKVEETNMLLMYLGEVTEPAKSAGKLTLVHETSDQIKDPRKAWIANKGSPRARRAPNVSYDNPSDGTDGHQFNDQVDMFNGAMDRYTWKLVGKKEMYIAYNAYEASSPKYKYADILKENHFNPEPLRYELHRVWVVEANLKEGTSHTFTKRTFYVDEDMWGIVAVDNYNKTGDLYRFQEGHGVFAYDVGAAGTAPEIQYDLSNGDYISGAMSNEGKVNQYNTGFKANYFTTGSLKRKLR